LSSRFLTVNSIIVGAIVYLRDEKGRILLQRRRSGLFKGYVGLPGGKIEFAINPLPFRWVPVRPQP